MCGSGAQSVRLTGNFGSRRLNLGTRRISGNGVSSFSTSFKDRRPRAWSPASPNLYNVNLKASAGGRAVSTYRLRTGIRSIRVSGDGQLVLNGQRTNFRGVGVHEDSKAEGFAVDNAFRRRLVAETKAVGATLMRTHYPMHPYTHELADREGVMIWSEVPVYALKTASLAEAGVKELAAKELEKNIIANQNHPSVLLWSIANELSARPGPTQASYIKSAARQAKALDPSRPVGIAVAGYPLVGCQKAYAPLDVIGVNDYFGWYPGPMGSIFDRTKLPAYLDQLRACYPRQALMVTEFGAEANRDGPVEEKGTYAYQQDFINYHLGVYAQQALAERRDLLGAQRVPRAAGLGGRQPAAHTAAAPEGPAALRRPLAQARVDGPAAQLRHDEAVRLGAGTGRRCGAGSRAGRRSRRGLRSRRRSCERSRSAAGTASGSGTPPGGELRGGRVGRRSLPPPPPPSSSSGGCHGFVASERRNITNRSAPSATAIRCSVPKMSISSASGDIPSMYPERGVFTTSSLPSAPAMARSEHTALDVLTRPIEGSRSTRRLRREGLVPGVVYGGGDEPVAFSVNARVLRSALAHAGSVLDLAVDGGKATPVIVKDVQNHPVRGEAIHVDLLRVDMSQPIHSTAVLELTGADESPGVSEGGVLSQETRELNVARAAGRPAGRHHARRLGDGDERDAHALGRHRARRRHAARRSRGDRHRHDHPADARAGRGRDRDRDRAGRRGRRAARGRRA